MSRWSAAALGTEPAMTEAALAILAKGGTSVDACIAGLFAAAGSRPGVLLGSMVLLVAGTGVGSHVFDGSAVQPGLGAPRPRGFVGDEDLPVGARIAVAASGAMLAAAHAHDGSVPMSELATPGVRIARACRAAGRANLIRRVGEAGPIALREASFTRSLLDVAGRPEGGNVTAEDFAEVQACVGQPAMTDGAIHVQAPTAMHDVPSLECVVNVACDHRGVLTVVHCAYDPKGPEVAPHEVVASRLAVPVRRGVPRVRPGTPIRLPVPIALLTNGEVPWAAVGIEGVFGMDWGHLVSRVAPDLTLEQSLRAILAEGGPGRRALTVIRGASTDVAPRACEIKSADSVG